MLLELLADGLVQLVLEVLFELGVGEEALRSRTGRRVTLAVVGFAGGLAWAAYLHGSGQTATPRTLWVSLALAVGAVIGGLARRTSPVAGGGWRGVLLPWHWPAERWDTFAILNAAIAVGVWVGFR